MLFLLTSRVFLHIITGQRGVAKFGIALGSGPRGLGFESRHSDQIKKSTQRVDFFIWLGSLLHITVQFLVISILYAEGLIPYCIQEVSHD